ncbi:hypothetical protein HPC62_16200 [Thermoleptolyngbya sichuanensis A183]|uniref:Uncharacterized protein n=1 Tax=Thermoleptolyngbya sichuanensis A183 TaxID=2737172 RepID=A0A6M8BMJ4_9CYAN|nr:hypothetical protein [Thermoleptolyngbya sichuanensis]QKD83535.1 hypothetical protein HPC62_16200 [Thermoleptolyngbya sichuanensis A183]
MTAWQVVQFTEYPDLISNVRTYNAPGIGQKFSDRFNALERTPQVDHFIDDADVVSAGGESFLKGQVHGYSTASMFSPVSSHLNLLAPDRRRAGARVPMQSLLICPMSN